MQKASIENTLMDFTAQLNDAAQSFQVRRDFAATGVCILIPKRFVLDCGINRHPLCCIGPVE